MSRTTPATRCRCSPATARSDRREPPAPEPDVALMRHEGRGRRDGEAFPRAAGILIAFGASSIAAFCFAFLRFFEPPHTRHRLNGCWGRRGAHVHRFLNK